jgi:hypothetical protein
MRWTNEPVKAGFVEPTAKIRAFEEMKYTFAVRTDGRERVRKSITQLQLEG